MENNEKSKLIIGESKSKAINRFATFFLWLGWFQAVLLIIVFFISIISHDFPEITFEEWMLCIAGNIACFFNTCILRGFAKIVYAHECIIAKFKESHEVIEKLFTCKEY